MYFFFLQKVLCGKKLKTVVNNESAGIIRMFNTELNHSHDLLISKLKSMKLTNGFTMGSITVSIDVDLQRTKNFSRRYVLINIASDVEFYVLQINTQKFRFNMLQFEISVVETMSVQTSNITSF